MVGRAPPTIGLTPLKRGHVSYTTPSVAHVAGTREARRSGQARPSTNGYTVYMDYDYQQYSNRKRAKHIDQ